MMRCFTSTKASHHKSLQYRYLGEIPNVVRRRRDCLRERKLLLALVLRLLLETANLLFTHKASETLKGPCLVNRRDSWLPCYASQGTIQITLLISMFLESPILPQWQ